MTHKLHLHLEDEFMRIVESGTDQGATFQIPLLKMSEQFFHQGSLTASALEHAIEWTEDHLQLAKFTKPDAASLLTNDPHVKRLYEAAGIKGVEGALLHVGAVEHIFSRLVMQANGQAPGQDALPSSGVFYASVVVVRELMHHLGFPVIQLFDGSGKLSAETPPLPASSL